MIELFLGSDYMAGTLTHAYFALDLYDKLSINSKELLIDEKESLKLFAQNTDVIFFYNLLSLRKGKCIRNFGYESQKFKSYEFFSTLINYIKYNNLQYKPQVMSYLYGMLSHYVLDSTFHPYIIYKTGYFDKNKKNTYKYNRLHDDLETYFDDYMIKLRTGINPKKFKSYNFCFNVDNFSNELIEVIDFTYKEVYGLKNFHKIYYKACKQTKFAFRLCRYDPTGIKKFGYRLIDSITPKSFSKLWPVSYNVNLKKKSKYLNLEHKVWCNPADKKTKSNKSILELYTEALDKASNMIKEINQYIYYDKKINLKKVVGNLSYVTGKDCDKNKELKYFEF